MVESQQQHKSRPDDFEIEIREVQRAKIEAHVKKAHKLIVSPFTR